MTTKRRISIKTFGGDGKLLSEEKEDNKNTNNKSVIRSGDGKRILSEE
jgi:hypothetical protein